MIGSEVQGRQAVYLKEWHRYLLGRFAPEARTALEVGCGAGYVMENIADRIDVRGVDIDPAQVRLAMERGLSVDPMDGLGMSFPDGSFDLVYCSFYLMWVRDMGKALREMRRVSRGPVIVMSEPVWSRALFHPDEAVDLAEAHRLSIKLAGGEPDAGLRLPMIVRGITQNNRFGIVPTEMDGTEMDRSIEFEISRAVGKGFEIDPVDVDMFTVPFVWAFLG